MKHALNFQVTVEKEHMHPAISLVAFFGNIVKLVDQNIKFKLSIHTEEDEIKIEVQTESEQYIQKIKLIAKQYGEVLTTKIAMNELFKDNGEAVMALKQILDLTLVELQVFNDLKSNDSKFADINVVRGQLSELMQRVGSAFEK